LTSSPSPLLLTANGVFIAQAVCEWLVMQITIASHNELSMGGNGGSDYNDNKARQ
jgi:hypothetical protein